MRCWSVMSNDSKTELYAYKAIVFDMVVGRDARSVVVPTNPTCNCFEPVSQPDTHFAVMSCVKNNRRLVRYNTY